MDWTGPAGLGPDWLAPAALGKARPGMNIHSVFISYNRGELLKRALASYLETVTGPFTAVVVDNGSTDGTEEWLRTEVPSEFRIILLGQNRYPGFACNRGWELAPEGTSLLHRGDNDFIYQAGWETHVRLLFSAKPNLGQLGLRTDEEELHNLHNVGGNCVIRKELWDEGLRYDERPWPKIAKKVPGYTEDSFLSPEVRKMGWEWGRVQRPCIVPISSEDPEDTYYQQTWKDRGLR